MESLNTKITEALKAELAQWLDTFWKTYLKGDYELWATFVADDYYNIGGTKEEIWHSKQEILEYSYALQDQMVDQAELRNRKIEVIPYGVYLMLNEFTDLFVKIEGEWAFYGPFRMSSLMSKTKSGWIALHQHGSYPDMKATEGEAFASDALKAENNRLQEAVNQRTAELQEKNKDLEIEAALERVRTVAMGMATPDDMLQVCKEIADQLDQLGVKQIRNVQTAIIESKEEIYLCYQYFPSYNQEVIERTEYLKNPVEQGMVKQMLATRDSHFLGALTGDELTDFRTHRKEEKHFNDPLLEKTEELGYCFLSIGEGGLGITLYRSLDEQSLALFKRFHQVFSLAYKRFRDIQQAELQAREAEIELALERVRAQTMAMHSSDDVGKCIVKMFEELTALGVNEGTRFGIGILNHENENNLLWTASKEKDEVNMHIGHLEMSLHPLLISARKAWKAQIPLHTYVLEGEDLRNYYQMINDAPDYKLQVDLSELPERELHYGFVFEHGFFYAFSPQEFNPDLIRITHRFCSLFGQTYQRYLDLVRAEAQAREAQIEAALERVRSKSIGMHKSTDLIDIAQVLFHEVEQLGVSTWAAGFNIMDSEKPISKSWMSLLGHITPPLDMPHDQDPTFQRIYKAWKNQEKGFVEGVGGEDLVSHYHYMMGVLASVAESSNHPTIPPFEPPTFQVFNAAFFKFGYLMFITFDIQESSQSIFHRFANVFEQAYTRFLDLQKAEAQAREAEVELALERVRARTMAMQSSSELLDAADVMLSELTKLNIEALRIGICTINGETEDSELWTRSELTNGKVKQHILGIVPKGTHPVFDEMVTAWKESKNKFSSLRSGDEVEEYYKTISPYLPYPLPEVYNEQETISGFFFSEGSINVVTLLPMQASEEQILLRFAKVFDQTYTRFLDLQRAEAQAREAQIEVAIERVRAQSLAMHHPDDLDKVNKEILTQLKRLEVQGLSGVTFYLIDEKGWVKAWDFSSPGNIRDQSSYTFEFDFNKYEMVGFPFKTLLQTDLDYFVADYPLEKLDKAVYEFEEINPEIAKIIKEAISTGILTHQWTACCRISNGLLGIDLVNPPNEDTKAIALKMAGAFNQAYIRFLDLQKAEAQARESEIQLALERVRARTMAMQKSEELADASSVLDAQVRSLGINTWGCAFNIYGEKTSTEWFSSAEGSFPSYQVPRENVFLRYYKKGQEGASFYVEQFEGEDCIKHYEYLSTIPIAGESLKKIKESGGSFPTFQIDHVAFFKYGYLLFITFEPVAEADGIFTRFAKVFEQTYTRFLDLKKAEAQAREAQIEVAVERVRAKALAMHNSSQILEVVATLKTEMLGLKIPGVSAASIYLEEKDGFIRMWDLTSVTKLEKGFEITLDIKFRLEETDPGFFVRKIWANEETYFVESQDKNDMAITLEWLRQYNPVEAEMAEEFFKRHPLNLEVVLHPTVRLAYGRMSVDILGGKLPDEMEPIMIKMGAAFDLAYKRFLDLQKAEDRAKEAQIEAALERVRSRSMGMQKSDELNEVILEVHKKFKELEISMESRIAIVVVFNSDSKDFNQYIASQDVGNIYISTPYFEHPILDDFYEAKEAGVEFFSKAYTEEEKNSYFKRFFETSDHDEIEGIEEQEKWVFDQKFYTHSQAFQKNSCIGMADYSGVPLTDYEIDIIKRFSKVFDQAYTRFLDLKKAEAQAREAQIETALERIRSRSLAMHHSSELSAVVDTLLQEFTNLEFTLTFCIINLIDEQDMGNTVWAANPETGKDPESYYMKFEDYPFHHAMWDAWKSQKKRFVYTIAGEEKKIYDEYLYSETEFRRFPKHVQDANKSLERYVAGFTFFEHSGLQTVSEDYISEEDLEILERFGRVFEQAYTRFLDLQKAEAQAREAKIEAALEKVRSRTMAMQKGEEVKEVVVLLYKELIALGVTNFVSCGYVEINEETKRQETWVTSPGGDSLGLFYLPLTGDVHFDARYKAWKEQQTVFHQTVAGNERKKHLEYAITTFNSKEAEEMVLSEFPDPTVFYCFNFSHGYLHVVAGSYLEEEETALLARFTRVFEQTYARFLDLQKAEEQAREAQIEAAMERIRSRAIAMRTSEELMEVMIEIRRQIDSLGQLDLEASVVHLYTEGEKMFESIAAVRPPGESGEIVLADVHFPVDAMAQIEYMMEMYTSDTTEYTIEFNKQMAEEWQQVMLQYAPMIAERRVGFVDNRRQSEHSEFWNFADFNGGSLLLVTHSPASPDTKEVLRKASNVFNLAYGRYKDLLRAEARAREAQIEAALERIRGQVAAMSVSPDLLDIVVTMRTEFTSLGHEAGYFWHMRWLAKTYEKAMTSGDGTKIGMIMSLPRHIHGDIKKVADWEKSEDPILVLDMDTDTAVEYVHKMITLGDFEQVDPNAPTLDDIRHIQGLTFVMARTTHGEIGFSLPGKVANPPQEAMDTLIRFAGVFDLAYKRFEDLLTAEANTKRAKEDLIKLKKSKSRAEKALKELKSAQEQLVQQEKLASLGQLTAGIAHEIKNPLNFVNNFSELSRELIEEVFEELEKLESSEIKEEIMYILNDVKSNLLKVHEHGSRADGIVTSMLQHSRASGNKREAKEFNPLVKEFVNLSFHGMRAGKNPIDVEIAQELDSKVEEVTLIQEDFSRVILNLCNNAFDAMRDKLKTGDGNGYLPKLTVKTVLQKDKVLLSIADNGGGIPAEIKDKILQPFFTTKKGTEGTGLGLSITHDIIKAHGGELIVESSQDKGSIFSISIPIQ